MSESVSEVQRTIQQAKDALTVRRVYGEPYEKDGVTIIPAARVQGLGGGGSGEGPDGEGKGTGSGFAVKAKPAGAYVIHGDEVEWRPAGVKGKMIVALTLVVVAVAVAAAVRALAPHEP